MGAATLLVLLWTWVPAAAEDLDRQGYWWQAQQSDAFLLPPPAHVPEDGLWVARTDAGPHAVAAVRAAVTDDARSVTLELTAARSDGNPALVACPVQGTWKEAVAGRWSERPSLACGAGSAVGTPDDAGEVWTFDLTPLVGADGMIDVALVPAPDAGTFSVSFAAPGDAALGVEEPTEPSETGGFTSPPPGPPQATGPAATPTSRATVVTDRGTTPAPGSRTVAPVSTVPSHTEQAEVAAPVAPPSSEAPNTAVSSTASAGETVGTAAKIVIPIGVLAVVALWATRLWYALGDAGNHPLALPVGSRGSLTGVTGTMLGDPHDPGEAQP